MLSLFPAVRGAGKYSYHIKDSISVSNLTNDHLGISSHPASRRFTHSRFRTLSAPVAAEAFTHFSPQSHRAELGSVSPSPQKALTRIYLVFAGDDHLYRDQFGTWHEKKANSPARHPSIRHQVFRGEKSVLLRTTVSSHPIGFPCVCGHEIVSPFLFVRQPVLHQFLFCLILLLLKGDGDSTDEMYGPMRQHYRICDPPNIACGEKRLSESEGE